MCEYDRIVAVVGWWWRLSCRGSSDGGVVCVFSKISNGGGGEVCTWFG